MNKYVVILALVNGMIGGLILVIPILTMNAGSILSLLIILGTGFFSFYSCYLSVLHLGQCSDLDKALLQHFNQSRFVSIFYNFLVFFGMLLLLMLYFNLIVTQWRGLLPYNIANPICNAIALIILTFILNSYHFGTKLLGYGIVSIIGYCIFLVWLLSSAPQGPNSIPLFGHGGVNLAASMGQAFSIQGFFIPVLRQLPQTKNYMRYVLIAYLIGGSVYLYIAFAGSFGIVNRKTVPPGVVPQTIQNYFQTDEWQIAIVEVLYLIHLYSAYGQFLLICKKRFFRMFNIKQSKQGHILNIPEIIFLISLIGITVAIFFTNVSIRVLIQINGAVLGFFFIYFLPAFMHFVCLYYPGRNKSYKVEEEPFKVPKNQAQQIEMGQAKKPVLKQLNEPFQSQIKQNKPSNVDQSQNNENNEQDKAQDKEKYLKKIQIQQNFPKQQDNRKCNQGNFNQQRQFQQQKEGQNLVVHPNEVSCACKKPTPFFQAIDLLSMTGMVGMGAFIMVDGLIGMITGMQN